MARVPPERQSAGIRWLVLEHDENSRGWFLFGHQDLHDPSEFDSWYQTRADALREAAVQWGVVPEDWRVELP